MENFNFEFINRNVSKIIHFITFFYLTITAVNSIEIRLEEYNKLIYDSNLVDGLFYFNPYRAKNNCSCDYIYTVGIEQNSTLFTISKSKNESFTVLNIESSNDDYGSIDYKLYDDEYNYKNPEIIDKNNFTLSRLIINHTCKSNKLGWSLINLIFETDIITNDSEENLNQTNPSDSYTKNNLKRNQTLSFVKLCDEESKFSKIIPSVFTTFLILLTTKFVTKNNLNYDSALRKFRNPKFTCLFIVTILICISFSFRLSNIFEKIIIGSFFVYIVTSIFGIYKRIKHAFIPVALLRIINRGIFTDNRIKISNVILLLISALIYLLWYYTFFNWLLTNFFVFCVISCMAYLFQIQQFLTILISVIVGVTTVTMIIIYEYYLDKNRVNTYEMLINYPIQFQVPKFFWDDPRCLCIFADYVSIVLNMQILNYCKKIDRILYVNKYYIKCFTFYFYYVIFLGVILILDKDNTEIFRNYLILFYPASAIIMSWFSFTQGEFKIFFRGKVFPGENLSVANVIEIELEKEENVI